VVGTVSAVQTLTLTNSGGSTLTINSITAGGDYARSTTCGSSLGAGGSCSISVTFTPNAAGTRNGQISVSSNASGSPHTVDLAGTGTSPPDAPALGLSPARLNFGDQVLGETSATQTVTLTNAGGADLNLGSVAAGGDFAQTNTCPAVLGPSASCSIQVTFTPSAIGAHSGQVTISDNAAGSPHVINLAGMGTDFSLDATPASLSVNRGQSASYQIMVSPVAGAFNGSIALSCGGLPNFAQCGFSSNPVTPGGGNMAVTLTISTTSSATLAPPALPLRWSPWYALALPLAGLLRTGKGRWRRRGKARASGMMMLVVALMLLTDACGGGGGGSSSAPPPRPPASSFTITVQGTHGSLQHTKNVVLTVN